MLNISVPHCELNTHLWVWSVLCVKSRLQGYNISTAEAPSQRRITRLFFFPFADTHIYIHTYIYIDLLLYFLSVPTRQFVWLCVSCFYITGPNLLSRCFRYKHKTLAEIMQTLQFVAAQSRRQRKLLIVVSSFEVLRQDWGDGFLYYLVYVVCVCVCRRSDGGCYLCFLPYLKTKAFLSGLVQEDESSELQLWHKLIRTSSTYEKQTNFWRRTENNDWFYDRR